MTPTDPRPSTGPSSAAPSPDRVRLTGFRVRNYRSIVDSGPVPVFDVTALVGKNRSGKTSLLRALAGLYPSGRTPYSLESDWPRHIGRPRSNHEVVCRADFALPREVAGTLAKECDLAVPPEILRIGRRYSGAYEVEFPGEEQPEGMGEPRLLRDLTGLDELHGPDVRVISDRVNALRTRGLGLARAGRWSELRELIQAAREELEGARAGKRRGKKLGARRAGELRLLDVELERLEKKALAIVESYAERSVSGRRFIPPLLLLGRETLLPPEFEPGPPLRARRESTPAPSSAGAEAALLEAAGLTELDASSTLDARALEKASARLAETLGWPPESRPLLQSIGGRLAVRRGGADQRWSSDPTRGDEEWRWALTLDLLLAASREAADEVVLLLDDPTRIFADAQRLRDCWRDRARVGTIVYTAPLPFHVNLRHPEQLLVLSPVRRGPFVRRATVPGEEREGFDLRASLGMTGRSSFPISERNLVVEGPYDASVIGALSELAGRAGEESLPEDLSLIAAGGAREVANVTVFLDALGVEVVALLDSDDAGRNARASLLERFADREGHDLLVLDLGDLAGFGEHKGAIEDLFPEAFYLECVRTACAEEGIEPLVELPPRLPGERKITAELRELFDAADRPFPKGRTIEVIVRRLGEMNTLEELPAEMRESARSLLRGLRAAAESVHTPTSE